MADTFKVKHRVFTSRTIDETETVFYSDVVAVAFAKALQARGKHKNTTGCIEVLQLRTNKFGTSTTSLLVLTH